MNLTVLIIMLAAVAMGIAALVLIVVFAARSGEQSKQIREQMEKLNRELEELKKSRPDTDQQQPENGEQGQT
jgi:uncharacterized membrane-anchored protein YhcB (DUF1043 family)